MFCRDVSLIFDEVLFGAVSSESIQYMCEYGFPSGVGGGVATSCPLSWTAACLAVASAHSLPILPVCAFT